jgi:hypothetical protein
MPLMDGTVRTIPIALRMQLTLPMPWLPTISGEVSQLIAKYIESSPKNKNKKGRDILEGAY